MAYAKRVFGYPFVVPESENPAPEDESVEVVANEGVESSHSGGDNDGGDGKDTSEVDAFLACIGVAGQKRLYSRLKNLDTIHEADINAEATGDADGVPVDVDGPPVKKQRT